MQQLKEKLAQLEAEKGELAEAKEKIEAQEKELTKVIQSRLYLIAGYAKYLICFR